MQQAPGETDSSVRQRASEGYHLHTSTHVRCCSLRKEVSHLNAHVEETSSTILVAVLFGEDPHSGVRGAGGHLDGAAYELLAGRPGWDSRRLGVGLLLTGVS